MMEDYFRDICNIGTGYERVQYYCRADFHTQETTVQIPKQNAHMSKLQRKQLHTQICDNRNSSNMLSTEKFEHPNKLSQVKKCQ